MIEHRGPQGAGSPLHVHRNEDEWFYVTEGELTFWVGGESIEAPAGSFVYGPARRAAHVHSSRSPEARFLLVTEPAGFEGFMRALAAPATSLTLPPASVAAARPEHDDGDGRRVRDPSEAARTPLGVALAQRRRAARPPAAGAG